MKYQGEQGLLLTQRENDSIKLQEELAAKKELMALEYYYQTGIEVEKAKNKRSDQEYTENRKDKRTAIQATQQSRMKAEQSGEGGGKAIDFNSAHSSITGELGMDDFRT